MSASGADVWSAVTTAFDFGDGSSQTGGDVSHTYAAAGTYAVTVTATDSAGNTATSARTIGVAAPPVTDPPGNPPVTTNPAPNLNQTPVGPTPAQIKAQLLTQLVPKGTAAKRAKVIKAKRYTLSYKALTAGAAKVTWSARSGGKTIVIGTGSRRFSGAGSAAIEIKLTGKGLKLLKAAKRLTVTATSTFSAPGASSVTVTKTFVIK